LAANASENWKVGDESSETDGADPNLRICGSRIDWYFCLVQRKAILWNSSKDLS